MKSKSQLASTGHGTGALQAKTIGPRRRMRLNPRVQSFNRRAGELIRSLEDERRALAYENAALRQEQEQRQRKAATGIRGFVRRLFGRKTA